MQNRRPYSPGPYTPTTTSVKPTGMTSSTTAQSSMKTTTSTLTTTTTQKLPTIANPISENDRTFLISFLTTRRSTLQPTASNMMYTVCI